MANLDPGSDNLHRRANVVAASYHHPETYYRQTNYLETYYRKTYNPKTYYHHFCENNHYDEKNHYGSCPTCGIR